MLLRSGYARMARRGGRGRRGDVSLVSCSRDYRHSVLLAAYMYLCEL